MTSRLHISTIVGVVVLLWMAGFWIKGVPLSMDYLGPYSLVVSAFVIIMSVFEKWMWSWAIFRGWFICRPDIRGSWKAKLNSTWIDKTTGEKGPPIVGYVAVRQTLTTLSFRLMTAKSNSQLLAHTFIDCKDGTFQMAGIYLNSPKIEQRNAESQIHYGSVLLQINGVLVTSLEGHYWTDRNTCGSLLLTQKKKKLFYTYEEADSAFSKSD